MPRIEELPEYILFKSGFFRQHFQEIKNRLQALRTNPDSQNFYETHIHEIMRASFINPAGTHKFLKLFQDNKVRNAIEENINTKHYILKALKLLAGNYEDAFLFNENTKGVLLYIIKICPSAMSKSDLSEYAFIKIPILILCKCQCFGENQLEEIQYRLKELRTNPASKRFYETHIHEIIKLSLSTHPESTHTFLKFLQDDETRNFIGQNIHKKPHLLKSLKEHLAK